MKTWQNKIGRLRLFLRGWTKNENGNFKKRERGIVPAGWGTRFKSRVLGFKPTRAGLETKCE